MQQTTISFGDKNYALAQNTDVARLKAAAVDAVHNGGDFIDFTVVGNREVCVLLPCNVIVVVSTADVSMDDRDTGDVAYPYNEYDLI